MSDLLSNENLKTELLSVFESKEFQDNIKDINVKPIGFSYTIKKGCICSNYSFCSDSCCENVKKFVKKFTESVENIFLKYELPSEAKLNSHLFIRCESIDENFFDTCKDNSNYNDLKEIAKRFAYLIGRELSYFNLFKSGYEDSSDATDVSEFFKNGGYHSRSKRRASKKSRKSRRHRRSSYKKKRHSKRHTKRYKNRK
jgi:hypothetical protein